MNEVTQILSDLARGDAHAAGQLLPLVYEELRKLAAARLAQEAPGNTLTATALVHEAYLRLVGPADAARRKRTHKHGGHRRRVELPDVPAMPELGYAAISTGAWVAILAPLGTPPAIIERLNQATNNALKSAAMREPLARLGAQPRGGTPEDLARHMKAEHDKWGPIVARLGLKEE